MRVHNKEMSKRAPPVKVAKTRDAQNWNWKEGCDLDPSQISRWSEVEGWWLRDRGMHIPRNVRDTGDNRSLPVSVWKVERQRRP
jgi:hypothetical protein